MTAEFQMPIHRTGIGGGGGHDEMIIGHAGCRAVIHDETVIAQHQPIADLADGQFGKTVAVDTVDEFAGISPLDINLAEGRDIADTER